MSDGAEADIRSFACAVQGAETWLKLALHQYPLTTRTAGLKGPVQSKSMFISIDQLPKLIEFHNIIVHNYSSVDFILIFE